MYRVHRPRQLNVSIAVAQQDCAQTSMICWKCICRTRVTQKTAKIEGGNYTDAEDPTSTHSRPSIYPAADLVPICIGFVEPLTVEVGRESIAARVQKVKGTLTASKTRLVPTLWAETPVPAAETSLSFWVSRATPNEALTPGRRAWV